MPANATNDPISAPLLIFSFGNNILITMVVIRGVVHTSNDTFEQYPYISAVFSVTKYSEPPVTPNSNAINSSRQLFSNNFFSAKGMISK